MLTSLLQTSPMSGFKERQLDSPLCVSVVCCDMSGVEIHDRNLASTKILSSGAFLMVSCKKKKKKAGIRSMNVSKQVRKTY